MIFSCETNLSGFFLNCFDRSVAAFKENLFFVAVCCPLYFYAQIISKSCRRKICTYIAFFAFELQRVSSVYAFDSGILSFFKILSAAGSIFHIIHRIMNCRAFFVFLCLVCKVCPRSCSKRRIIFFCRA